MISLLEIKPFIGTEAYKTFARAETRAITLLAESARYFEEFFAVSPIDPKNVCMTVMGSFGRREALEASDFDLLPVARDDQTLAWLLDHNTVMREGLAQRLQADVSTGRDLTKAVCLEHLTDPECIGGDQDDRTGLTQRILVLTEAAQAGGALPIADVRRDILNAYAHERTAGRHPLAFCNDLARYYRTVCIDYKARVDTTAKDWCTRNVKLRHSRKLWYFASLVSVAAISQHVRPDDPRYVEEVLDSLALSPILRLFRALDGNARIAASRVLDQYAWYLDFMASEERRAQLTAITFDKRYEAAADNPFPGLQWNSKVLHMEMIAVLENVGSEVRSRVLDWFLL